MPASADHPPPKSAPRIAGVELGGTKVIALIANGPLIVERLSIPTTTPGATLGAISAQLAAWHSDVPFDAVGVASFGPLRLDPVADDFGHMLATPKPGWAGANIAGIVAPFACPFAIDTDVNGAALAEQAWGAGKGSDSLCYITIGTGVGGGLVLDGRAVHGAMHPEIGHMQVRRAPGDDFPGICPFHGDCVEGLVAGPALAPRFGVPGDQVADDDPRWANVASDLAGLVATILLTTAARRVLIGGGVGISRSHLLPAVRHKTLAKLAGYLPWVDATSVDDVVRVAGLGDDAGPLGAVALGLAVLRQ